VEPRPRARYLDAAGALALVLHYLGSAMLETSLQQIFALVPTTGSRYLHFARGILLTTLCSIEEVAVRWPETEEELEYDSSLPVIQFRHLFLEGTFGSVDGLSLPVQEADDPVVKNAMYNGWKCSQLVFSPRGVWRLPLLSSRVFIIMIFQGTIIDPVLNAPGSWHDSIVARKIFQRLEKVPDGYYPIADSAFS
jgi:hypothetical protein